MRCQMLLCVDFLNSEARQPSFHISFNQKKKINIGIFQVASLHLGRMNIKISRAWWCPIPYVTSEKERSILRDQNYWKKPQNYPYFLWCTPSPKLGKISWPEFFFLLHSSVFLQFGSTSGTFQNSFDEMLLCVIIDFSSRVKQEVYVHISDINTTTLSKCYTSLSQSGSENINMLLIDLQAPEVDGMRGHARVGVSFHRQCNILWLGTRSQSHSSSLKSRDIRNPPSTRATSA